MNSLNITLDSVSSLSHDQQCSPDSFADLLESVYASSADCPSPCKNTIRQLPRLSLIEFSKALSQMLLNRCADCFNISIEMIKYGTSRLHCILLSLINDLIDKGAVDSNWKEIIFSMVPKQGDLSLPRNWRPIAIFVIFYK